MSAYKDRKLFQNDCLNLKKKGVRVKVVTSKVLDDYAGMNHRAAKDMHFPNCPKNVILIRRDLPAKDKRQVLRHEIFEESAMKRNGNRYIPAHRKAMDRIG